ncbi:BBE domain-containing protein [Bradyrhizobium sp. AZCC 2230]|uniref:BBE domain-containing protein n=1 Tax=Bradyrhizobium sp. AZCC 2230 TaxID=3117021 RepID=UPI002FF433F8
MSSLLASSVPMARFHYDRADVERCAGARRSADCAIPETRKHARGKFGGNAEHLIKAKRRYDPDNVFRSASSLPVPATDLIKAAPS